MEKVTADATTPNETFYRVQPFQWKYEWHFVLLGFRKKQRRLEIFKLFSRELEFDFFLYVFFSLIISCFTILCLPEWFHFIK